MKFKIMGNLRCLSHLETLAMFQRALIRAGINLRYSQGFNPRPVLSIPFPRSVGLLSDDELLCVSLLSEQSVSEPNQLKNQICSQLPQGCEIVSVEIAQQKTSFKPDSAVYVFPLVNSVCDKDIKAAIDSLCKACTGKKPVIVERQAKPGRPSRRIDVSPYIKSVEYENNTLLVECNITPAGSVRVDEILQLLQIDSSKLSGPIKRRSVQWRNN